MVGTRFRYNVLPAPAGGTNNLIRLLILQPALSSLAPLSCRMVTVSLADRPRYEAISYIWDNQVPSHPLSIQQQQQQPQQEGAAPPSPESTLLVTPNVSSALRHLRGRFFSRSLWIDSVCIDQTSVADRTAQITCMDRVYETATRVVVWLGEGDGRATREALWLLKWRVPLYKIALHMPFLRYKAKAMLAGLRDDFQDALDSEVIAEKTKKPEEPDFAQGEKDKETTNSFRGLKSIIHHNWFRRLWTLQEISLARRAVVQCGPNKISWRTLSNSLTFEGVFSEPRVPYPVLMDGGYNPSTPIHQVPFLRRMHQIQGLRRWMQTMKPRLWFGRQIESWRQPPLNYIINLILTGLNPEYRATLEADRFWGLLGILQALRTQLAPTEHLKEALPLPGLLQSVFKELSIKNNSLEMLLHTTGNPWCSGLPSWVPSHSEVPWSPDSASILDAANDQKVDAKANIYFHGQSTLRVPGQSIGEIDSISRTMPCLADELQRKRNEDAADPNHTTLEFLKDVEQWIKFIDASPVALHLSSQQRLQLSYKLLLHPIITPYYEDCVVYRSRTRFRTHRLVQHFNAWLEKAARLDEELISLDDRVFDQAQHFVSSEQIVKENNSEAELESTSIGYIRALLVVQRWVRESTAGKRLFTTKEGGMVGIAWQSIRPGDEIMTVPGVKSPLVARRINHTADTHGKRVSYRLMGPCHIPAIDGLSPRHRDREQSYQDLDLV